MQFGIAAVLFKQSSLFQNLILTMQAANESNLSWTGATHHLKPLLMYKAQKGGNYISMEVKLCKPRFAGIYFHLLKRS